MNNEKLVISESTMGQASIFDASSGTARRPDCNRRDLLQIAQAHPVQFVSIYILMNVM